MENRKNWKQYSMYLDPATDQDWIAMLQPYVANRRVGEFLRAAIRAYIASQPIATASVAVIATVHDTPAVQSRPIMPQAKGSVKDTIGKLQNAFGVR